MATATAALEKGQSNCRLAQITIFKLSSKFFVGTCRVSFAALLLLEQPHKHINVCIYVFLSVLILQFKKTTCCAHIFTVCTHCRLTQKTNAHRERKLSAQLTHARAIYLAAIDKCVLIDNIENFHTQSDVLVFARVCVCVNA